MDIELNPSPNGKDCLANGQHEGIEISCDECNFFLQCFPENILANRKVEASETAEH